MGTGFYGPEWVWRPRANRCKWRKYQKMLRGESVSFNLFGSLDVLVAFMIREVW